jgi:hypothetical protein
MDAPITAVARGMAAATGTVEVAGITVGVAITAVVTAIAHRPKARGPEAAMVLAPVAAGMAIPAGAVVADHVPASAPEAVGTEETAVSVVVVTADQAGEAAAIAE